MIMRKMSRWGQVVISIGILVWGSQGLQGCTWLGGNSLVETRMYPPGNKYDSSVEGISYYLPKRLVKVTVSRERVDLDRVKKAKEALAKAKTAEEGANKAFLEAKKSKQFTEELAKNAKDPGLEEAKKLAALGAAEEIVRKELLDEAKKQVKQAEQDLAKATIQEDAVLRVEELKLQKMRASAQKQKVDKDLEKIGIELDALVVFRESIQERERPKLKNEKEKKEKEREALKKLLISLDEKLTEANIIANLNVTGEKPPFFEDKITIEQQPLMADTSKLYVANLEHSPFREDVLKLTTTSAGLLNTAEGEADDRTGKIIQVLGQIALKGLTLSLPSGISAAFVADQPPDLTRASTGCHLDLPSVKQEFPNIRLKEFTTEFLVDPTNDIEIRTMNESLCRLATKFKIVVKRVEEKSSLSQDDNITCKSDKNLEGKECTVTISGLVYRRPYPYVLEVRERYLASVNDQEDFKRSFNAGNQLGANLSQGQGVGDSMTQPEKAGAKTSPQGNVKARKQDSTPNETDKLLNLQLPGNLGQYQNPEEVQKLVEGVKNIRIEDTEKYQREFNERFTSVQKSLTLEVPNKAPTSVLPMETEAFVTTKYKLGFENGMLTKYEATRPSQIHEVVKLPLALVEDAFASVGELIKLKVDYSSKEVQQAENEKKLLELQNEIEKLSVDNARADRLELLKEKTDYTQQLLQLQKALRELQAVSPNAPPTVP